MGGAAALHPSLKAPALAQQASLLGHDWTPESVVWCGVVWGMRDEARCWWIGGGTGEWDGWTWGGRVRARCAVPQVLQVVVGGGWHICKRAWQARSSAGSAARSGASTPPY